MGGPQRNRLGPTIVTVVFLVFLVVMAPILAKYRDRPQAWVEELQAMSQPAPETQTHDRSHSVWVNRRSGLYYCRDSKFYGRMRPGEPMEQESALLKGFRPADGKACP